MTGNNDTGTDAGTTAESSDENNLTCFTVEQWGDRGNVTEQVAADPWPAARSARYYLEDRTEVVRVYDDEGEYAAHVFEYDSDFGDGEITLLRTETNPNNAGAVEDLEGKTERFMLWWLNSTEAQLASAALTFGVGDTLTTWHGVRTRGLDWEGNDTARKVIESHGIAGLAMNKALILAGMYALSKKDDEWELAATNGFLTATVLGVFCIIVNLLSFVVTEPEVNDD